MAYIQGFIYFFTIDDNFYNSEFSYKNSIIYKEFKSNNFTTLSEYFNLDEPNNLQKYSKFYEFYPWIKNFNLKSDKLCGPYSDSLINMHFLKFKRILEGIKKYGVKYNFKNMISGYFLKKDNKYKFLVESGIHRTIVLKYLLLQDKIKTTNIICEKEKNNVNLGDVENWYHVKKNTISVKNSKKIFNQLFNI